MTKKALALVVRPDLFLYGTYEDKKIEVIAEAMKILKEVFWVSWILMIGEEWERQVLFLES